MPLDAWFPRGFSLPDGLTLLRPTSEGLDWQIWEVRNGAHLLIAKAVLAERWLGEGLVDEGQMEAFSFGAESFRTLPGGPSHLLVPVSASASPNSKAEALAFAVTLRVSRESGTPASFHDAIYAERISRLLPTYTLSPPVTDDILLGTWLTGGVPVSTQSVRRLGTLVSWLGHQHLLEVINSAGQRTEEVSGVGADEGTPLPAGEFELAGRPALESFFREHVLDITENPDRYRALGIDFPSAIVLHGPPGCGKTFAVERLVEHLGWPSFNIDASSVASPYIHETSHKVAGVFEEAMNNAPAVLVIDEMEAFLADRGIGGGGSHHRVEEVAEFLRRIPEATENQVLVIAMTNRLDMIDSAILRRGRFDHVIEVSMPSSREVEATLRKLLGQLPVTGDIDSRKLAEILEGRPLSDVAFVVREGARLAARGGKSHIDAESLHQALEEAPSRATGRMEREIGFGRA